MKKFDYFRPKDINEALALKEKHVGALFLSGGTDIFVKMKNGSLSVKTLIDIGNLDSLTGIVEEEGEIVIGAACKVSDIERAAIIKEKIPVLAESAHTLGSPQVRNLATIGGNICNASPSADLIPALLVLDAKLEITGAKGECLIPVVEFFQGPGSTILSAGEMLKAIRIPVPHGDISAIYLKQSLKQSMDIAVVGVALLVKGKDVVEFCRIGLGAVAPTPLRAYEAEKYLTNKRIDTESIARTALLAKEACRPIDDVRTTAAYRAKIVEVMTKRGLGMLVRRRKGGQ